MKTYKVSPEGLNKSISKILLRIIPLCILVLAAVLYMSSGDNLTSTSTLLIVFILIIVVLTISIQKSLKKQKESLLSYELIVSDNSIVKKQLSLPTIEIAYSDITGMEEITYKGLIIRTNDKSKAIGIPYYLIDYEEVKNTLSQYGDIKKNTSTSLIKISQYVLPIFVILALIIVIKSNNRYLILPFGTAYILFSLWFIIEIFRNKQITSKLKQKYLFLIFPLLAVILKMIFIFSN
ncbi:hypothetical protein [Clostridium arbusti]|uniref:hypothetical protein n=1 Tax=Clostridium arbusti TaxID=1137848 RepID=UPI0002E49F97|nr:hypothetical protein [Clostridium arbusti]